MPTVINVGLGSNEWEQRQPWHTKLTWAKKMKRAVQWSRDRDFSGRVHLIAGTETHEPVLILELNEKPTWDDVRKLADATNQDAIAVIWPDGYGELLGPRTYTCEPFEKSLFHFIPPTH